MELLAKRGWDAADRKHLKKLVETALGPTAVLQAENVPAQNSARREKLLELKLWYNEWATVAHTRISKRAHLIRMGLANRRAPQKDAETPAQPEPTNVQKSAR